MSAAGDILGPASSPPPDLGQSVYRSALVADKRVSVSGFAAVAVLLHVGVVAAALVLPGLLETKVVARKPVIARLVAQGKPRPKGQLPRKERPPPPGAAPLATPAAPTSAPSLAPSKAARGPSKGKPPPRSQPSRQELMRRALAMAGANTDGPRPRDEAPLAEREGLPEGSPEGTATDAQAGDKYFTEVHDAILANYVLPSVISERERLYLKASLVAFIGPDGSLLKHQILKPSGNALFDQALEAAVKKTKLPAPPAELRQSLRDEGVELNFKP